MCEPLVNANGKVVGFICRGHGRKKTKRCHFCRRRVATLLCDYPTSRGKTCSTPLCPACAVCRDGCDYCPSHESIPATHLLGGE